MPSPTEKIPKSTFTRVEQQFRKKLGPFLGAAETTPMPMIFTDGQETEHSIVFANDAFLMLTGLSRNAILAVPFHLVMGGICDSAALSAIKRAMADGDNESFEMQCRCDDNSEYLAAVSLTPICDEDTIVRQYLISFTELGAPLGRLLKQQNEFHALYEHAPALIATSEGPDHRFTFANASYKRSFGKENVVGLTVGEALPEIANQGFIDVLDQVYRSGEPFVADGIPVQVVDPATGHLETRDFDAMCHAVRDANNVVTGIFFIGHDVTAKRQNADAIAELQAKLIHVSRINAMGTMATTLAHELNQPLSAITNYTAGVLRRLDPATKDAESIYRAVEGISEATKRAAEVIRHLREFSTTQKSTSTEFDLKSAIKECIRLVRASVSLGVNIDDRVPEGLMMKADRIQIQQVIINLLANACDAAVASDHQQVFVSAQVRDSKLVVSVTDTGPGVPIEIADKIFNWTESAKEGGMGIGLSICRTIIEEHQGRIWLEESGKDGSTFCFSVPLPSNVAMSQGGSS